MVRISAACRPTVQHPIGLPLLLTVTGRPTVPFGADRSGDGSLVALVADVALVVGEDIGSPVCGPQEQRLKIMKRWKGG